MKRRQRRRFLGISNARRSLTRQRSRFCRVLLPRQLRNVIRVPTRREMLGAAANNGRTSANALAAKGCADSARTLRARKLHVCLCRGILRLWVARVHRNTGKNSRMVLRARHSNPLKPVPPLDNTRACFLSSRGRIAEYVLHMHSFINLRRDTASSNTPTYTLKRGQETCL